MKKLTVKQKLIGMTVLLFLMLAGMSIFFIERFGQVTASFRQITDSRIPQERIANIMLETLLGTRVNINEMNGVERSLATWKEYGDRAQARLKVFRELLKVMVEGTPDLGKIIEGQKGTVVPPARKGGQIESLAKEVTTAFGQYEKLTQTIMAKKREQLEMVNVIGWYDTKEQSAGALKKIVETGRQMEDFSKDNQQLRLLVAEVRRQEKNILQRADESYIIKLKEAFQKLRAAATGDLQKAAKEYYSVFEPIFDKVLKVAAISEDLKSLVRKDLRESQKKVDSAVGALSARAVSQMNENARQAISIEQTAKTAVIIIALVVGFLSLALGWFTSSGLSKVLRNVISSLNAGADQVVAATSQVSAASQSLAEGTSEQAASLEETAASLEEMASMSKQNADNASQADTLMRQAKNTVVEANSAMDELTDSMQAISNASEEISKIIKTIDEIAFQTNLLALNAAVEAARAGEHGAGFAVVADEVRNLAMRAGEAAKNTSALIEDTVHRVQNGSDLVSRTNEAFKGVSASSEKVAELVSEIAAASAEQSQGVDQINKAMSEMDKVIQQNASNAEESAAASEEMNAQASEMKGIVNQLVVLVGGSVNHERQAKKFLRKRPQTQAQPKALPPVTSPARKESKKEAQKALPLEEEDFKDF